VRLDLPMNIALSRIMVVEAGGQMFGVPMDAVTETVRLGRDRISRIKNNDGSSCVIASCRFAPWRS
jgi:two-component system chemotaxis sensor kinase CheA